MAMRETERSLRIYFLLAGVIGTFRALSDLGNARKLPPLPTTWMLALWVPIIAHLVLGPAFVIAGVKLKTALRTDTTSLRRMLVAAGAVLVIELVVEVLVWGRASEAYAKGQLIGAVTLSGIGIAIAAYLYANVVRLSREAKTRDAAAAFE
jgi:hypothetical protein